MAFLSLQIVHVAFHGRLHARLERLALILVKPPVGDPLPAVLDRSSLQNRLISRIRTKLEKTGQTGTGQK
jgi:hypothetical protein